MRVVSREQDNTTINRAPIGAKANVGYLGLVREAGCTRTREGYGNDLHPESYTGLRTVKTSSTDWPTRRKRNKEHENRETPSRHLCTKTLQ